MPLKRNGIPENLHRNEIREGFGSVPGKEELLKILAGIAQRTLAPEWIKKEKCILFIFDGIRSSVPRVLTHTNQRGL